MIHCTYPVELLWGCKLTFASNLGSRLASVQLPGTVVIVITVTIPITTIISCTPQEDGDEPGLLPALPAPPSAAVSGKALWPRLLPA